MSEQDILTKYRNVVITFIDELIDQFPSEGELIMLRFIVNDKISDKDLMNIAIKNLIPNKDFIKDKNDVIFLEKNLFDLNKDIVTKYKKIWRGLNTHNKTTIWKWLDSIVYIVECYQKIIV